MLIVASTAAAPDMSIFITWWNPSLGFRLSPPESYMTPLPTSTTCFDAPRGEYVSFTSRGGSTLPRLTPRRPPQRIAARSCSSNTSTARPVSAPIVTAMSAMRRAVRCAGGVLARSRASPTAPPTTTPRSAPAATPLRRSADASSVTERSAGVPLDAVLRPPYLYAASSTPSVTACPAA